MLILYTPAFLAGVASFALFPNEGLRFLLLSSALTIHFFKRDFEVLFIHKYSGMMVLDSVVPISLSYFISTVSMIYAQHLTQGFPEPPIDLKYPGVALFLVGIGGFVGVSFISQALYPFALTLGTTFFLLGRSYATRNWYRSKLEDFPKDVKAMIPFVF
ncbi:3-oxo-5-alpha-steroid 4-dehydrogenase, C-terminal [Dillenia turbinata]|uniref:3-oxo-5-alpha-steroid 4-dehydrogenase, C-terminal n=1 Tax=Dillenia turbinata TaxID=194707 RepID=A0AAN8VPE3_9MAGN